MKRVFVDVARCMGCHSCEVACAIEHSKSKDLFRAMYEEPRPRPFNTVLKFDGFRASLRCAHCDDAPCVAVCPTSALYRDPETDLVVFDTARCIGCWQCAMVCPFGAIYPNPITKVSEKCDGCVERVRAGSIPACVEACPTNALIYTTPEALERYKKEKVAEALLKSAKTLLSSIGVM